MKREVELIDGSVLLRPCRLSDADAMYEAARESIAELSVWMTGWLSEYSFEECRTWLESQPEKWEQEVYSFVIIGPRDNHLLGGCGLRITDKSFRVADLSYWIRTGQTKRGLATTSALLLARFGFNELNLNRIEIVIAVDNKPSQRVAEKTGAIKEGVLRNRLVVNGKTVDAVMFSLISQDVSHLD